MDARGARRFPLARVPLLSTQFLELVLDLLGDELLARHGRHGFLSRLAQPLLLRLPVAASGLDFGNSYVRNTDLSGIDFRNTNLQGASLLDAKLSGTYFPPELSPEEIRLSLDTGTRMRYTR